MDDSTQTNSDSHEEEDSIAEELRRKYLYRKLVINGGIKMPARLAMKMVGPDCAFHLYRNHQPDEE
ncbi:hypothetical protein [Mariniblastus fucicola]|uniref:Uncharacterized protein n=1 Tax=Mariniblastus fucicola TaxID=980251 RepID=A0A5B9PFN8_9BACT|nr:hypothetical protein [Mariniblastus fucicola]QEG21761.1 hypothetical protein MFFC18_16200 [Mariniblastus fucicola]